ncbi:MAG: hypothetical protein ACP5K2_05135 [bacterium]
MRIIHVIIIFFLIFLLAIEPAYANTKIKKLFTIIPQDKQLHFTWGFVLTTTITALTGSFIIGMTIVILLEFSKEYLIDDFPDWEDITYTVIGSLFGYLISSTLINIGRLKVNSSIY